MKEVLLFSTVTYLTSSKTEVRNSSPYRENEKRHKKLFKMLERQITELSIKKENCSNK